jgi:hypothetical protein
VVALTLAMDALNATKKMAEDQMNPIMFKRSSFSSLKRILARAHWTLPSFCRLSFFALALLVMHSQPLHAQAQRTNTNSANAVLHIQVTVVPTTFSPAQTTVPSNSVNSVTYSLPGQTGMDVIEENHTLSGTSLMAAVSSARNVSVLETTTVVPR